MSLLVDRVCTAWRCTGTLTGRAVLRYPVLHRYKLIHGSALLKGHCTATAVGSALLLAPPRHAFRGLMGLLFHRN